MKRIHCFLLLTVLGFADPLKAELHELLKPHADKFKKGMESYEETRKSRIDLDRSNYLKVLNTLKRHYERSKKPEVVAVIDDEIRAANAGTLAGDPPADLPEDLHPYRLKYIDAPKNAAKAIASVQKSSRESYLRTLDALMDVARIGKSAELETDVTAEKKRVLADLKAAAESEESATPKTRNTEANSKDR